MPFPAKLNRRAVLKGLAGVTLALPLLEAMGKDVAEQQPRRFCAIYTANGMSLPNKKNGIDEWSWFPAKERRKRGREKGSLRCAAVCGRLWVRFAFC